MVIYVKKSEFFPNGESQFNKPVRSLNSLDRRSNGIHFIRETRFFNFQYSTFCVCDF